MIRTVGTQVQLIAERKINEFPGYEGLSEEGLLIAESIDTAMELATWLDGTEYYSEGIKDKVKDFILKAKAFIIKVFKMLASLFKAIFNKIFKTIMGSSGGSGGGVSTPTQQILDNINHQQGAVDPGKNAKNMDELRRDLLDHERRAALVKNIVDGYMDSPGYKNTYGKGDRDWTADKKAADSAFEAAKKNVTANFQPIDPKNIDMDKIRAFSKGFQRIPENNNSVGLDGKPITESIYTPENMQLYKEALDGIYVTVSKDLDNINMRFDRAKKLPLKVTENMCVYGEINANHHADKPTPMTAGMSVEEQLAMMSREFIYYTIINTGLSQLVHRSVCKEVSETLTVSDPSSWVAKLESSAAEFIANTSPNVDLNGFYKANGIPVVRYETNDKIVVNETGYNLFTNKTIGDVIFKLITDAKTSIMDMSPDNAKGAILLSLYTSFFKGELKADKISLYDTAGKIGAENLSANMKMFKEKLMNTIEQFEDVATAYSLMKMEATDETDGRITLGYNKCASMIKGTLVSARVYNSVLMNINLTVNTINDFYGVASIFWGLAKIKSAS